MMAAWGRYRVHGKGRTGRLLVKGRCLSGLGDLLLGSCTNLEQIWETVRCRFLALGPAASTKGRCRTARDGLTGLTGTVRDDSAKSCTFVEGWSREEVERKDDGEVCGAQENEKNEM